MAVLTVIHFRGVGRCFEMGGGAGAKRAKAARKGVSGGPPPEIFWKMDPQISHFGLFQEG